ncbi:MAG: FGGY-family carbohydrate kinase, partial [Acidimicrobiia bacterium]|nr:FGGY-family carbohydrate kinase [Acidimicrobiia bacterium]
MTEPVVVGLDVGSSSARAVAVTRSGAVVTSATAGYPPDDLAIGEADPASWLVGAAEAIGGLDVEPVAICIGGQGPTTVAATGERALTFRHQAGAADGPPDQHFSQVAVLRETFGDHIQPRQLWDWMTARLGGRDDSQSLWPGSGPLEGFGEPIAVGSAVGETNGEHGIPGGITLAAGANDAYMTAWGCGIDVPGKGFDPGGTTGGLGVAVRTEDHPDALTFGMASHVPGVYIIGGPVAAHGAMLDWWSQVTGRGVSELLDLAADSPAGAEGVMVLPFLEGERAPRWNLGLRAEITGLHISHGVGAVTRALLESTAYGLGHIASDLAA